MRRYQFKVSTLSGEVSTTVDFSDVVTHDEVMQEFSDWLDIMAKLELSCEEIMEE